MKGERTSVKPGCNCDLCLKYDYQKWSEIMNCRCMCHTHGYPVGHNKLCCQCPNVSHSNCPYPDLSNHDTQPTKEETR